MAEPSEMIRESRTRLTAAATDAERIARARDQLRRALMCDG
ncbi:hypothetical protein ABZU86_03100 [Streptomyces sp. NPDC005271]